MKDFFLAIFVIALCGLLIFGAVAVFRADEIESWSETTIESGDTLWSIYHASNTKMAWGEWYYAVCEKNEIVNPGILSIGAVLLIPAEV